ncbi:branched-chain-amino-acid transaminase [Kamptonema cortianum]|nr:branched-chain-amino-acid transaminase [Kamptonema cortianum]MDL5049743.1 branched-chain-amino-acid transaminase [Oscillatoria amoena NRMC-F 0135]
MKIYLDGKFVDKKDAKISVFDHGLLYGDGVFEGIRAYHNRVFRLSEHIDRLFYSAKAILLDIPMTHAELCEATVKACKVNKISDGYIRLVVTRGVGNLGLSPWNCERPSVFIIADKIQLYPKEHYEKGLAIATVATRRIPPAALNPAIKSLNYLNNILAKIEARHCGCEEAIMLNQEGYVAECTGDNVFIVNKGRIYTPPSSAGALKGITRDVIFDLADHFDMEIHETQMTRYDVYNAEEMFITGTAAEICPVTKVDLRQIGTGKPGSVTKKLISAFRDLTKVDGEPIR